MERQKFVYFENRIKDFYLKLEELLSNNERVSINLIQNTICCGFTTAMKLKTTLIELNLIDSDGYVLSVKL